MAGRSPFHLWFAMLGALSTSALAWPAHATVHPVAQTREVTTFAFLDAIPGGEPQRTQETLQSAEPGDFSENAVCHLEEAGSQVTALSSQASTISPSGITADIIVSAEGLIVPPAQATLGIGSSSLSYDFDVDAATLGHIVIHVIAQADGVVDLHLRVRGGSALIQRQFSATDETFDQSIILPAGAYQLIIGGGGDGGMGPAGFGSSFIDVDFSMEFPVMSSVAEGVAGEPVTQNSTWSATKQRFE